MDGWGFRPDRPGSLPEAPRNSWIVWRFLVACACSTGLRPSGSKERSSIPEVIRNEALVTEANDVYGLLEEIPNGFEYSPDAGGRHARVC